MSESIDILLNILRDKGYKKVIYTYIYNNYKSRKLNDRLGFKLDRVEQITLSDGNKSKLVITYKEI